MSSISELMKGDHRHCDEIYASAEEAISREDFGIAGELWVEFVRRMEQHFLLEEETLFLAFEAATGMQAGPTTVMRSEHAQMREIMKSIAVAIEKGESDEALGQGESLMIYIQQHNMKEEQILYPMLDDTLSPQTMTQTIKEALV